MTFKHIILPLVAACVVSACSNSEAPRASATEVTEIALSDVPQTVNTIVSAAILRQLKFLKKSVTVVYIMMLRVNCPMVMKSSLMF